MATVETMMMMRTSSIPPKAIVSAGRIDPATYV
jgi:hypothetical protein